jgi:hypothetical protein
MRKLRLLSFILAFFYCFESLSQNYTYLGSYDSQGVPNYLTTNDELDADFLSRVNASLPESYPVPYYNADYIATGIETNIILEDSANIWVTFVKEGAGYKNALGYYVFDANNPPATPPPAEQINIIFPNVSNQDSGGGLLPGNKVNIGLFPAGIGIGWVLVTNGWDSSKQKVGQGYWTVFSEPTYNPESDPTLQYHNVQLIDEETERVVLGFEHMRRDYFSDIAIKTSNAVNLNDVDLGDAEGFAILSKSGITNVYPSAVTGDVGTSPITGAALLLTCNEVDGAIYTVAAAGPLPCRVTDAPLLTTAVLNMQTAYTDVAGRTNPDVLNLGAGVIGGQTLTSGVYKWTSTLVVATDITLEGRPDDVWIFQVAGTFNMSSAVKISLAGGAQARNIFWQVAGAVTLGTTSHFEGTLLGKTSIAVQTGATVNGRLLAQTAVTLQMNGVTLPQQEIEPQEASETQDFNDAVFFITIDPIEAIALENINYTKPVEGDISSGNQGGLESDGSLAEKIARRNIQKELINKDLNRYTSSSMAIYTQVKGVFSNLNDTPLSVLVPELGPDSTVAYQSTPLDLLDLTNAVEVLSIDYFDENLRKAVCLVTKTQGAVYSHTKSICDRVGGAELIGTSTILIGGVYPGTLISIKGANGGIEYAMSFSLQEIASNVSEYSSHWNINDYATGGMFINFQLWGKKPSDVFFLSEEILGIFNELFDLTKKPAFTQSPNLLMRRGEYSQGKLKATLINKKRRAGMVHFEGTLRNSEQTNSVAFHDSLTLSGAYLQEVQFNTQGAFDLGLNIYSEDPNVVDAVYLADGAWIANYEESNVSDTKLIINPLDRISGKTSNYLVERSFLASGKVKNYYSVHRPLRLGLRKVNFSDYKYLSFVAKGSSSIEVVISHEGVTEWASQPRMVIALADSVKIYQLLLSDFVDTNGNSVTNEDITALTFSVIGDNSTFEPFDFELNNLSFIKLKGCESNKEVLATSYSNEIYTSTGNMEVSNNLLKGSSVLYTSENSIEFKPGFESEAGAVISAQIKNCENK